MAWNGISESPLWFMGAALVGLVVVDQFRYQWASRGYSGPRFVVPFVGSLPQMIRHPYKFWDRHFKASKAGQSMDWLLGRPLVVSGDGRTSREIFRACSESVPLVLHPNADLLLAKNNLAFMNGEAHTKLKHELLSLFTNKRLTFYATIQQREIRRAIREWCSQVSSNGPNSTFQVREHAFALNVETSLKVLMGPFLTDTAIKELQAAYQTFTKGFLSWPLNIPGTDLNRAVKARAEIIKRFEEIAGRSRAKMKIATEAPACVIDFWMRFEDEETKKKPEHSDYEVACVMLDLEFASQDASTSSLTSAAHFLSLRKDVRDKIREEVAAARLDIRTNGDSDRDAKVPKMTLCATAATFERALAGGPIDLDMLAAMPFTRKAVEELLRLRPPATIVPHAVQGSQPLRIPSESNKGGLNAPVGSIVCPSIWNANREGVENADEFDPFRKDPPKTILTFGDGRHQCIGQRYARQHLMLFFALFSEMCEFDRVQSDDVHEIDYLPTIYPRDGCRLRNLRLRF
jgi:cytochrome P450 family 710 subfamily A protein